MSFLARISDHFRRRRMRLFAREFAITAETRILDVGGTPDCWQFLEETPRVTLLNQPRARADLGDCVWVAGDGTALPFADQSFDIVFSNSVIEHVGDLARQKKFASEIARVGRTYWVQTPNRWFPVEQHMWTPLIHWLPKSWQRAIVPRFTVWNSLVRASPDRREAYHAHYLRDIRLLDADEFSALFPNSRIIRERFLGITKSLVAVNDRERSLDGVGDKPK